MRFDSLQKIFGKSNILSQGWIQVITQPLKVSNVQYRRNSGRGSHSEGGDALSVAHGGTLNLSEVVAHVNAFTPRGLKFFIFF